MSEGVSVIEIDALESSAGFSLPVVYRNFLLRYGVSGVMVGTDYEYSKLADIREWSEELVRDSELSSDSLVNSFVFAIHQGYQFFFFKIGSGDDPRVYSFTEGDASIRDTELTFSAFLDAYQKDEQK